MSGSGSLIISLLLQGNTIPFWLTIIQSILWLPSYDRQPKGYRFKVSSATKCCHNILKKYIIRLEKTTSLPQISLLDGIPKLCWCGMQSVPVSSLFLQLLNFLRTSWKGCYWWRWSIQRAAKWDWSARRHPEVVPAK